MIDIDFFVIVLNWLLASLFTVVVLKNIRNVTDGMTAIFWLAQCAFAGLRGFNALLFSREIIELNTFKILSTIITFLIFGYLMWYFVKKYGDREKIRLSIQKRQIEIINKRLPFNLSVSSEFLGLRGYHFDLPAFLKTVTDEWKYLGSTSIKYRAWKGVQKYDCVQAVELIIEKDEDFGLQWHEFDEMIVVFKGSVELKAGLVATPERDALIIENDTHGYKVPAGTHHVSYFI